MTRVEIVGCGLAGLSAAIALKTTDPSVVVTVHEKYPQVGYNHEGRRCGEAHLIEPDWAAWQPTPETTFTAISTADITIGRRHLQIHPDPGTAFILNRQAFIAQLGRQAEQLGAVINTNSKIMTVDDLDADYIIDASGCPSTLKRSLHLPRGTTGITYQQSLQNSNSYDGSTIKIIYTGEFGYFWVFPRDPTMQEVNVGIGLFGDFRLNLRELLEEFKTKRNITGTVAYTTGGLVPAGLQPPLQHENILFVGDAGVGAFPLTGQGIYRALMSGDVAGRCIANHEPDRYRKIVTRRFLTFDILGKFFLRTNHVLRRIGPRAVMAACEQVMGSRLMAGKKMVD